MSEKKEIKLTVEEQQAIEARRAELELLEEFKIKYNELVEKTGYTWAVDGTSPLNNIKLGIAKTQ